MDARASGVAQRKALALFVQAEAQQARREQALDREIIQARENADVAHHFTSSAVSRERVQTSAAERLMGDGQLSEHREMDRRRNCRGRRDGPTFQPCIDPRSAKIDASLTARHQTVARANEPQHATREVPPPPPSRHDVLYSHGGETERAAQMASAAAGC